MRSMICRLMGRGLCSAVAVGLVAGAAAGLPSDRERAATARDVEGSPVADALASVSEDVRRYDVHISTLANPYMQGRVPGSAGSERAKDYVEYHFREFGLSPAFPGDGGKAFTSYRQPFPLRGTWSVSSESMAASKGQRRAELAPAEDFMLTGMGPDGSVRGGAVLVGYGIDNGPDGYDNFAGLEGAIGQEDLTGRIAVLFRFEPMDDNGQSLWNDGRGWSNRAAFANKIRATAQRNPEGIVIINPPGSADPRADRLSRFQGGAQSTVPVFMLAHDAADGVLEAMGVGRELIDLRRHADGGGAAVDLGFTLELEGQAERQQLMAENIGGVIEGVGELADEWIVVGAHMDHLGMGYFGSRAGPGELHPGADDNASGTAGVLLLAELLSQRLAGDTDPRRSILLVCFDAEESGLNGSAHYTREPIAPIEDHLMMINWDMIGRVKNGRLLVAGGFTGEGLGEFIEPYFDSSGLDIVVPETMSGASDHTPFYRAGMPVLFSIIADFHDDYHTPEDKAYKINRVGAAKTVRLYEDIIADAAEREQRFAFVSPTEGNNRRPQPAQRAPRVRVGVVVDGDADEAGVTLAEIVEDGPAAAAGLVAGDRLVRWDGQKLTDMASWRELLARHEPGDTVNIGVVRQGEEVTLTITLEGR